MTYVAILAPLALAFFALLLGEQVFRRRERTMERREAAWLAERKDLLDRLMYMAEKPWEGPPQEEIQETPVVESEIVDPLYEVM